MACSPALPSWLSPSQTIDATRKTGGLSTCDYPSLINHLASLTCNTVSFAGPHFDKITNPTPMQRRAFSLLATPIQLTLTSQ